MRAAFVLLLTLAAFQGARPEMDAAALPVDDASGAQRPITTVCQRNAPKLVGKRAVLVEGLIRAPNKIRHVNPAVSRVAPWHRRKR